MRYRNFAPLNFPAFFAALIAAGSPDAIFSAPTFLPFVGQPYFSCFLKIEQDENIQQQKMNTSTFFMPNSCSNLFPKFSASC